MINEYLTDPNDEFDISYDTPNTIGMGYSKVNMYNSLKDNPTQKFWFYIKKSKIVEIDGNYLTVSLSNNINGKIFLKCLDNIKNNLIEFINSEINKNIKTINKVYEAEKNRPIYIRAKIDNMTPIFRNNNKIKLEDLNINDNFVSMYLEINEIIISQKEKKAWMIWKILQIKVLDSIDFSQEFFEVSDKKQITTSLSSNIQLPTNNISERLEKPKNKVSQESNIKINTNGPMRFQISQSLLLNQLKKLNKTTAIKDENTENNIKQDENIKNTENNISSALIEHVENIKKIDNDNLSQINTTNENIKVDNNDKKNIDITKIKSIVKKYEKEKDEIFDEIEKSNNSFKYNVIVSQLNKIFEKPKSKNLNLNSEQ